MTWLADSPIAEGHCYPARGRQQALCGAAWFDPKFAWPVRRRCNTCRQLVEEERVEKKRPSCRLGTARMTTSTPLND